MFPIQIKNLKSLKDFKSSIWKWEQNKCDCKLYFNFVYATNISFNFSSLKLALKDD